MVKKKASSRIPRKKKARKKITGKKKDRKKTTGKKTTGKIAQEPVTRGTSVEQGRFIDDGSLNDALVSPSGEGRRSVENRGSHAGDVDTSVINTGDHNQIVFAPAATILQLPHTQDLQATIHVQSRAAVSISEHSTEHGSGSFEQMVLAFIRAARESEPKQFATSDFGLYYDDHEMWFRREMWIWQEYVAQRTKHGPLEPPDLRPVLRYVPLKNTDVLATHLSATTLSPDSERLCLTKASLHWMLSAGATVFCSFGNVLPSIERHLVDTFASDSCVLQTPGMYEEKYDTVRTGRRGQAYDVVQGLLAMCVSPQDPESTDIDNQGLYMLFYSHDNFRADFQNPRLIRNFLGRFLWRLQGARCPMCGPTIRWSFEDMDVVQVYPAEWGGNATLVNAELRCKEHAHSAIVQNQVLYANLLRHRKHCGLSKGQQSFLQRLFNPRLNVPPHGFPLDPHGSY